MRNQNSLFERRRARVSTTRSPACSRPPSPLLLLLGERRARDSPSFSRRRPPLRRWTPQLGTRSNEQTITLHETSLTTHMSSTISFMLPPLTRLLVHDPRVALTCGGGMKTIVPVVARFDVVASVLRARPLRERRSTAARLEVVVDAAASDAAAANSL